jgi:tripartite-type tricarboxylate transporter receptor subunit TctC
MRGLAALAAAWLALLPWPAEAQAPYPARTVKIVAPALPGGGVDLIARTVADQLGRAMAQSFVVENIGGGGGSIASQAVARAAPDGYTLMIGYVATHATNPAVRKVPYDPVRDFTPVAMVGGTPNILVVNAVLPVPDLQGLLDYSKANAGRLSYGTGGIGTLNHLAMEQFRVAAGIEALPVHYRSIAPAMTDLLGGQVQMLMPGLAAALPQVRAGKLRPLAVSGLRRHRLLPEVPTFEEAGYKGFDGLQWYGLVGPAKLPPAVVQRLNAELNKALAAPGLRERLAAEAIEPMAMAPGEFGAFMQADIVRWARLARERRISLED